MTKHSPSNMVFKCNNCGSKKNVVNGWCPNCGPVQTTPADYETKVAVEAILPSKPVAASKAPAVEDAEIVEE